MESLEDEMKSLAKVWITVLVCLTYCYIISRNIPKGISRLVSILPIIPIFISLPLSLTSIHLLGVIGFFIPWIANFKLLLFAFNQGPLSSPSISFLQFISIACFPINFKQNVSPNTEKSISQNPGSSSSRSFLIYAIKGLVVVLLIYVYRFRQYLHPNFIILLYCVHIYFLLELILIVTAKSVECLLGLELEPQFNQPFLSTSLQDFWGKRWNLVVTGILRPTIYNPVQFISARVLGKRWAQLIALLATFIVSGLMHELIFYYFCRVWPTWEVFSYFVLHGVCLAVEIELKRCLKNRFQLPPLVSGPLTVMFVLVTGAWLFFPQYLRCKADVKSLGEYAIVAESVKGLAQKCWVYFYFSPDRLIV